MERGVGNASVSGRPVMLCSNVLPANESWRAPDVTHLQLLDVMLMIYWSSSDKLSNSSPRHEKRVEHMHLLLSHAWCNVPSMQEAQPVLGMTVHPAVTWEQKRRQHAADYVAGRTPVSCALLVEYSATVGNCAMQEEQPLLEITVSPAETREHKRLRAKMNLAHVVISGRQRAAPGRQDRGVCAVTLLIHPCQRSRLLCRHCQPGEAQLHMCSHLALPGLQALQRITMRSKCTVMPLTAASIRCAGLHCLSRSAACHRRWSLQLLRNTCGARIPATRWAAPGWRLWEWWHAPSS